MKKICLLFLTGLFPFLNAQKQDYEKFIPKTPEVAAIGRYIDKSVSLGTGTIDYQIPIESVQVDNHFFIPIYLRYNTDGIKVNEESSNIGLGWSLSTTSFITRNIRSLPDKYNEDLRVNLNLVKNALNSQPGSTESKWLESDIEKIDTEPDEFIVNIFDTNFRFFYNYETKKFQSSPKNNYIINGNIALSGYVIDFNIIDENGNQYFFEYRPNTVTLVPDVTYVKDASTTKNPHVGHVGTWFLTKIITENKNIVDFKYDNNSYENLESNSYRNVYHISQYMYVNSTDNFDGESKALYAITNKKRSKKIGSKYPISDDLVNNHKINSVKNIYSISNNYDLILSSIAVNGKKRVEFIKSNDIRKDLDTYKVEKIKYYDYTEKFIKSFNLNQSYYNQEYPTAKTDCSRTKVNPIFKSLFDKFRLRLRLDALTVTDYSNNKINEYNFSYYEGELPSRLSYSQDLYGYYNGKNNCSLIPEQKYDYNEKNSPKIITKGDADRTSNIEFNKIGALKKVIYSKEGSIELEYENHTVSTINNYNETENNKKNHTVYKETVIGGLRIKKITSKSLKNSILLERKYTYSDGQLLGTSIGRENDYYKEIHKLNGLTSYSLQSTSSPKVVYNKVIEENFDIKEKKRNKKEYFFNNAISIVGETNGAYRMRTPPFNWKLNQVIKINDFTNNLPVHWRVEENLINKEEIRENFGVRIRPKNRIFYSKKGDELLYYMDYEYEFYPFYSAFPYLAKEITTEIIDKNDSVTTENNYIYENDTHFLLTKMVSKTDNKKTVTTEYLYPSDLTSNYIQSDLMKQLVSLNRINKRIIIKNKVEDKVVSETQYHYADFNGIIKPSKVYHNNSEKINLNKDLRESYDAYDKNGNITQYTFGNGDSETTIWGYQNQYPIARIEGLKYKTVTPFVNALQTLSNAGTLTQESFQKLRKTFPKAKITSYVYDSFKSNSETAPNGVTEEFKLEEDKNDMEYLLQAIQIRNEP